MEKCEQNLIKILQEDPDKLKSKHCQKIVAIAS